MERTVLYITWEDTRLLKKLGGTWTIKGSARPKPEDFTTLLWSYVFPVLRRDHGWGRENDGTRELPWVLPF